MITIFVAESQEIIFACEISGPSKASPGAFALGLPVGYPQDEYRSPNKPGDNLRRACRDGAGKFVTSQTSKQGEKLWTKCPLVPVRLHVERFNWP
jgi:hypothetical protein